MHIHLAFIDFWLEIQVEALRVKKELVTTQISKLQQEDASLDSEINELTSNFGYLTETQLK